MGSRLEKNSNAVRKRIEQHVFEDEGGDEYGASSFGGFGEYMRRKKIKLQNLDAERRSRNQDKPAIFRGVVAFINGYTQPSLNDLHKLIVDHGGGFLQYLDGKTVCTHIIAANITSKKREEFKQYRVVKPAWVVDSVKAGKLLAWNDYRVIEDVKSQRTIGFDEGKVVSQASILGRRTYKEQTDSSWYAAQVREKADDIAGRQTRTLPSQQDVYRVSVVPATDSKSLSRPEHQDDDKDDNPGGHEDTTNELTGNEDLNLEDDHYHYHDHDHDLETSGQIDPKRRHHVIEEDEKAVDDGQQDSVSHQDPMLQLGAEQQDEHAREKASYLQQEDLRPDHAGDRSTVGAPLFPNPKTAEEHNANLLADPRLWKSTVVNPAFLKQYYEESRLHKLSTWKAELKSHLQALAQEQSSSQKARQKPPKGSRRYILHVDFDSFFVAVSLLKHPEVNNAPAVVAHGGGSGSEIASCNYPAREFGVKNGMWMKRAQELCPNLKVLPYDFPAYEDASRKFYQAIMTVGGLVQSVSVDEALVDVSLLCHEAGGHDGKDTGEGAIHREQEQADQIGQRIRDEVKALTGCAVSVGIGGNVLQAKLALRKAKPAGQYQVRPDEVLEFIGPLPVQQLPGVAYSTGNKLEEIGIKYVKDIREISKDRLVATMGPKTGQKLWEYARGIDRTEVGDQTIRKSVSAEVNWGIRFATQEQAEEFITSICAELEKRLLNESVKGRQLTMKIMRRARDAPLDPPKHLGHGKCDVFNKSVLLGVATNDKALLSRQALSILRGFGFPPGELRGIGVQVTKLEPLKGSDRPLDGSQRMLQFNQASKFAMPVETSKGPVNDPLTPQKPKRVTFADAEKYSSNSLAIPTPARVPVLDGNDDVDSPSKINSRKPTILVAPLDRGSNAQAILNTAGTQFILPTQADPDVIASLPEDIRSRFARASNVVPPKIEITRDSKSRSESPTPTVYESITKSQIDPDTLAALPEDIRTEILAQYGQRSSSHTVRQAVLPQSPRTKRSYKVAPKRAPLASRRGGLIPRDKATHSGITAHDSPTLTQANFVFAKADKMTATDNEEDIEEVPAEVLAAMPPDIRNEIMERQQTNRLMRKGGLNVAKRKKAAPFPDGMLQQTLVFTPRAPRPTFTSRKLSTLPELREAITAWVEGTSDGEVATEDVQSLSTYLCRVVSIEKDMHKAVAVVKWLLWLVDQGDEETKRRWSQAIATLTRDVQNAISERGLGRVDF